MLGFDWSISSCQSFETEVEKLCLDVIGGSDDLGCVRTDEAGGVQSLVHGEDEAAAVERVVVGEAGPGEDLGSEELPGLVATKDRRVARASGTQEAAEVMRHVVEDEGGLDAVTNVTKSLHAQIRTQESATAEKREQA